MKDKTKKNLKDAFTPKADGEGNLYVFCFFILATLLLMGSQIIDKYGFPSEIDIHLTWVFLTLIFLLMILCTLTIIKMQPLFTIPSIIILGGAFTANLTLFFIGAWLLIGVAIYAASYITYRSIKNGK